ncbi:MAG: hypothetical protein ISS70_00480 [Phycisphaerae bacterium]|nr:hypothetical protein [Phycisphaerae bacterium]
MLHTMVKENSTVQRQTTMAGPNGCLEVFHWTTCDEGSPVAVLPNGYGMLRYAHTVCLSLATIGACPVALNFSGQGRSEGSLSLSSMTADTRAFLDRVISDTRGSPITILAHCTAMLPLIELNRRGYNWSGVKQIILYGYLANPVGHFERFLRKGRRYGVRINQSREQLPSFPPSEYAALPCELIVVHPRIPNNLYRASIEDVLDLVRIAHPRSFYLPDFGYAISDHPQKSKVDLIVTSFIAPYLGAEVSVNLLESSLSQILSSA